MFRLFPSHHQCACQFSTTQNSGKQDIFKNLFIILTNGKLKLKNTNVNNCILENIHVVLPLYHITGTETMARE